jgi:hypothetical protein
MSQETLPSLPAAIESDPALRRLREGVAATIALVVIVGTLLMMVQAFNYLSTPEQFGRVKDLLLFVNPLVGVVIGYYFNKVTSEARAEMAETTAKAATASAQQAVEERSQAQVQAVQATNETRSVKSALWEMGQAAEKLMGASPPRVGVLRADEESGEVVEDPRLQLQLAWQRAKRLLTE